jgi:2-polyprenyl-3-methyl-5-hydroxy-6-metoxy-1,4-benzoquinol methylase
MRDITAYAKNYIEQPFEEVLVHYRKKKILELINKYEHKRILEIGCGLDPFFNCFRDFEKLVILEPSTYFYENAKTILLNDKRLIPKVNIINNYLENCINELAEFNFDFILVSGLLHEIKNVSSFLKNLRLILTENTTIHVNVPNANSFHRILALEMGLINSVFKMSETNLRLEQQIVFDSHSLSELIIEHGYKIINSGSYFIKPFTHKQMAELKVSQIIDEKLLDGLFNMAKYMPELGAEIFIEFKIND